MSLDCISNHKTYTHLMRLLSVIIPLLLTTSAYAADAEPNIFDADLSHPDLEQVVTSFEQVCMPFVLHKTELTRELDKAHYKTRLESEGFVFRSHETMPRRYLIEPRRQGWRPPQATNPGRTGGVNIGTSSQFTIFNRICDEVVKKSPSSIDNEFITMMNIIPDKYKSMITESETFNYSRDNRMTAHLGWNYPSQNHPGKSCEIKLEQSAISKVEFTESFIEKDADWREEKDGWSQCVKEGTDSFRFTVKHDLGSLSLHLVRNDFYETNVCGRGWQSF